eukprot:CAMPEP_0115007174 /NCGR_PEP_ID=MMETSP0216-20121206/20993_1 /TAXON_ID=223996 /ORGANISM="Protocruzia adherens, Strain Boccale" /LENGTH=171 /DNA_ID=CAMNT_0002374007 /DNA_START=30 /DNA_END=545 /DNA_ORIENTATION=+
MAAILNSLKDPIRNGSLQIAKGGREMFGTVISHGKLSKTVKVKVDRYGYDTTLKHTFSKTKVYQVHDEENFCVTGDKVVIRLCRPISNRKRFFVREIIKAMPRNMYFEEILKHENLLEEKEQEPEVPEKSYRIGSRKYKLPKKMTVNLKEEATITDLEKIEDPNMWRKYNI